MGLFSANLNVGPMPSANRADLRRATPQTPHTPVVQSRNTNKTGKLLMVGPPSPQTIFHSLIKTRVWPSGIRVQGEILPRPRCRVQSFRDQRAPIELRDGRVGVKAQSVHSTLQAHDPQSSTLNPQL